MNREHYKNSIAIIGPMGIGKTLISKRLLNRFENLTYFSSDLLEYYFMNIYDDYISYLGEQGWVT